MSIHMIIKEAMDKHKSKIELTQWAVMSSFASMVYSDYIYNFNQKQYPTPHVLVPAISNVKHFLSTDGKFMKLVSDTFFDKLMMNDLFNSYMTILPELEMFHGDNIEVMATIFDLYILPNVSRHIPNVISHKFQLEDTSKNTFRESPDINIMKFKSDDDINNYISYLTHEFVLQLLMLCPTLQRDTIVPESNVEFEVHPDEILTINSDMAICPIHFTPDVWLSSDPMISKLKFVTNTEKIDNDDGSYSIKTNAFNQVTISKLESPDCLLQRISSAKEN